MGTAHTSGTSNNTLPSFRGIQMRHFVICTPQLETENWLQVLSLQKDFTF
jgi:hypothetical protein